MLYCIQKTVLHKALTLRSQHFMFFTTPLRSFPYHQSHCNQQAIASTPQQAFVSLAYESVLFYMYMYTQTTTANARTFTTWTCSTYTTPLTHLLPNSPTESHFPGITIATHWLSVYSDMG